MPGAKNPWSCTPVAHNDDEPLPLIKLDFSFVLLDPINEFMLIRVCGVSVGIIVLPSPRVIEDFSSV
jgi:hypothetical protein